MGGGWGWGVDGGQGMGGGWGMVGGCLGDGGVRMGGVGGIRGKEEKTRKNMRNRSSLFIWGPGRVF